MAKTLAGAVLLAAVGAAQSSPTRVEDLAWMSGRWVSETGGQWTEEHWSAPRGGEMIGFSRIGEGGTVRGFEFLRLAPGEDGVPVYFASPRGRQAVAFRLSRATPSSATFENPGHDFPQRIHYWREGDRMTATVSASDGGNAMSWTFERRP